MAEMLWRNLKYEWLRPEDDAGGSAARRCLIRANEKIVKIMQEFPGAASKR